MASKLNERDKKLLDGNLLDVVGNKPYENGKWGTQAQDFVYLELFDNNNNLIEYTNLPVSQFVANTDNNKIEFFPGTHIRNLGFESGIFTVRYNFLRKLAGDESAVLLHTIDKVDTKIGDIYTNTDKLYITDDGIVYNVTEQEYKDNPTVAEQLAVEDLRYQIDEISPSRTEVRLKAKKINSAYIDQFINIQTKNKYENVILDINFTGDNRYESKILTITPNTGDFLFTQQMVKGTLTLPDVYKVDEIEDAVRSGINIVENGSFENLTTTTGENGVSSIVYYGDKKGWDPELHEDAVKPIGWQNTAGFRPNGSFGSSNIWDNTEHIGYHAKVVQNEGVAGGNCLKFTDNNEIFESSPEWPTGYPYRLQIYGKYGMPKLSGLGVKGGDYMNIRMDIRSTVAGKGIQTAASYPNELLVEDNPAPSVPEGYFNPESPGPSETMPSSPPAGYQENTEDLASMMWPKPASTEAGIVEQFGLQMVGFKKKEGFKNPEVGDTTFSTTIGDPYGSWIIQSIFDDGSPEDNMPILTYTWAPNMSENLQIGALSPEEEWTWNGSIWVASPDNTNAPTPPQNTVNNINAVNHHPYVVKNSPDEYMGKSYYPRKTKPGQNRGWQTGTFLWDVESDNGQKFNNTTDGSNGSTTTLLFKDDLVWGTEIGSESSDTIMLWEFDALFPDVRNVIVNSTTNKTLYDDIFEKGFIQSVTRTDYDDGSGTFLVFYNNGDTLEDGLPHPDSNKWFRMRRLNNYTVGPAMDGNEVHLLSDINELLNDEVLASPSKFEVAFCNEIITADANYGGSLLPGLYFFTEDNCHYFGGGTSVESSELLGINMDDTFTYDEDGEKFKGLRRGYFPDVMIGRGGNITEAGQDHRDGNETYFLAYSRSDATKLYRTTKTSGANYYEDINEVFFNVGSFGIRGYNLTYGVRNPAATNSGPTGQVTLGQDQFFGPDLENMLPVYENVTPTFDFDINPLQIGALSPQQLWKWNGYEWVDNGVMPPRYNKTEGIKVVMAPAEAGVWETIEVSVMIPADWILDQSWSFYIYGNNRRLEGSEPSQGIVWVDNVFIDFTYTDQSETRPVMRPYKAQITSVSEDGKTIQVDQSYMELGIEQGQQDIDGSTPELDFPELPEAFTNFYVTYFNLNPKDLRTYLKFDNQMFLTTNFKQDVISVPEYPNSVVYKMYEPLPTDLQEFDECIVVKEMANPMEESINIVDFIPEENPRLVLKSPDLKNVESPVQVRTSQYKTESDILTTDTSISNELRNKFISQSLDSVELNTDYSRYENFINFGSAEKRIRNFKLKLENIESYKISSASYVGVSGSAKDLQFYHSKIEETKNNLDSFENYMYFESSSYQSGSLGQFYDNSWPKTSGDGTSLNPYVLAHTTSSQATNWFSKAITSSSLYDNENNNKLSSILPEFIKNDESNKEYLTFTDMIGQHFDSIWEYINSLSDVYDRRDKLDEGLSKDLIYNVAKSLGWNLADGKDLVSLPRYALGKEVTGSAYSDYSAISEKDISREIWGRIVNNMPFFLKNKGTVRALKGLINVYGIPSTILRVKEYGGPKLPDSAAKPYEITRKFTKALDFRSGQYIRTTWTDDGFTSRKPDTIEFRFRAATGSDQILVEKQSTTTDQDWVIRLKDNNSSDNYGYVSFLLSGSAVGTSTGQYKELTSSAMPVYDGDFYSVMVQRSSGSDNPNISQSYELHVGKYDAGMSRINLYSKSTMNVDVAASASFNLAWTGSGDVYIGGQSNITGTGIRLSGSIMEYRHWTEALQTSSFRNHIANPKAYDGNSISSSYKHLTLRYSFDDNQDLSSYAAGILDSRAEQQKAFSGSYVGFTGNFYRNVVDELKTHIPSVGALNRTSKKIRLEDDMRLPNTNLNANYRTTVGAYDNAPLDSNRVGVYFAPTDVINNDIINSVADLRFDDYLGDPRDRYEQHYRGLEYVSDNYWKKYSSPNDFWDYIRILKYYDQSMFKQITKMIPARAKARIGVLVEPNILERPKIIKVRDPDVDTSYYSSSVNYGDHITISSSYNAGASITTYDAYTGGIPVYSYDTGSVIVSASADYVMYEASGSEIRDRFTQGTIWSKLNNNDAFYSHSTITSGDVKYAEALQPIITGSRMLGRNQKIRKFFSTAASHSADNYHSSSWNNVDLDNKAEENQALFNMLYAGVKNTRRTTIDGKLPVEIIVTAPTKLVTQKSADSKLKTGHGKESDFKDKASKKEGRVIKETDSGKKSFKDSTGKTIEFDSVDDLTASQKKDLTDSKMEDDDKNKGSK